MKIHCRFHWRVERHFLIDPHGARFRIGTEVLDEIRQEVFAILP